MRTDPDRSNCDAEPRLTSGLRVKLPDSVRDNVRMLRRLHYRLADIMADGGFVEWLAEDAEMRLEALSSHMVGGYVSGLVNEAVFVPRKRKKPKKAKKSKKTAKRGSK